MSFDEDSNDSDWHLKPITPANIKPKKEKDPNSSARKDTRRFIEKWFDIFSPWLERCKENPDKPFCKACQQRLDNNGFRLKRHENTAKHARNLEILINSGEGAVIDCLNQRKKKKKRILDGDTKIKMEPKSHPFSNPDTETILYEPKISPTKRVIPKKETLREISPRTPIERVDIDSHYRSIERVEHRDMNMSDYYYGTPQPKKDRFDMFFDAISASVKTLPPKLAAEVKSRVSQVVAEFELRAICEEEAQEKVEHTLVTTIPAQVGNVVALNPSTIAGPGAEKQTGSGTTVTQYVYSYAPKS